MTTLVDAIDILMVEDNPGDVRLVREALADLKFLNTMHVVSSGEEALEYLHRENDHAGVPRPSLILLDLRLPGMSGLEFLDRVVLDVDLRTIPVVVLTSSDAESDILAAYDRNVNCFITKPVGLDSFMKVVRKIGRFWLAVVKLPPT